MFNVKKRQSIKWDNGTVDPHRRALNNRARPKGENGRILRIFTDSPPKPLQPTHNHHCLIQSIPVVLSERIKRKDGETMTKIKKRTVHDSHLRTPTPTQQFRPRFSTTTDPISTKEASIHASFQCGCNEGPYVRIGLVVLLSMVNVARMR
jgi:hypothetical protein